MEFVPLVLPGSSGLHCSASSRQSCNLDVVVMEVGEVLLRGFDRELGAGFARNPIDAPAELASVERGS